MADPGEGDTLRIGMLLWEPPMNDRPQFVWTVKSVGKKSARIICATEGVEMDATLRGNVVPKGWGVIDNRACWLWVHKTKPAT